MQLPITIKTKTVNQRKMAFLKIARMESKTVNPCNINLYTYIRTYVHNDACRTGLRDYIHMYVYILYLFV